MPFPQRKNLRLSGFDYSTPGTYFITICTHEKQCLLSRIEARTIAEKPFDGNNSAGVIHESPEVILTQFGEIVNKAIQLLPERFDLTVDKSVIMPNHIHLLLTIEGKGRAIHESPLHGKSTNERSALSKTIGFLKMNTSREAHKLSPEVTLWQRGYYDHVIRNEAEYLEVWQYIDTNTAKWCGDCFYKE